MKKTIINPPSTFPPYLHSRSLAVSHHRFLPPSRPLLPPPLRPSILPRPFPVSHHRFLPPSRPLLPPSLPSSILPLSFPAPRCPPASCRATQYTPCVYTVLVSCTGYCVGRAQPGGVTQPGVALGQWSGRAISRRIVVTHNCHHIKSCHRPVKQYITTHHNTEFISSLFYSCNTKSSSEVSLPPLLASLTPPLLLYSLGCSLPPRSLLPPLA